MKKYSSSRVILFGMPVALLLALAFFDRQYLFCNSERNVLGLRLVRAFHDGAVSDDRIDVSECQETAYLVLRWQLFQRDFSTALDYSEKSYAVNSERSTLLPAYFRSLLSARASAAEGDWELAITLYRQAFASMRTAAPSRPRLPVNGLMEEYQGKLIGWYRSRSLAHNPDDVFRLATWLWYADERHAALRMLRTQLTSVSESDRNRLKALAFLIEGELAELEGDVGRAKALYSQVSIDQRDLYLRSLLRHAQLASDSASEILLNWEPLMTLEYPSFAGRLELTGIEPLEPEVVRDGGIVCFAIFGQGSPPSKVNVAWQQTDYWIAEACRPNLILDPAFDWETTDDSLSPWYWALYQDSGNRPEVRTIKSYSAQDTIVCLNNPISQSPRRSGIAQQGPGVLPGEKFILLAKVTAIDSGGLTLMANWQNSSSTPTYETFVSLDDRNMGVPWNWIGHSIEVPPREKFQNPTWGMQIYAVNVERTGAGCISDLILVELDL